jgi:hypothetical protein
VAKMPDLWSPSLRNTPHTGVGRQDAAAGLSRAALRHSNGGARAAATCGEAADGGLNSRGAETPHPDGAGGPTAVRQMASTIPPASHLGAASTHTCQLAFGSGEIKPPVRRPLDHREQTRLSGLVKPCVPVGIGPDAGRWLQVTSASRSCSLGAESMYRASHRRSTQHVVFCGTPPVWQFIGLCATSFARF